MRFGQLMQVFVVDLCLLKDSDVLRQTELL
jgi:hypothetical protein